MQSAISCAQCNHIMACALSNLRPPFHWAAVNNPGLRPCRRRLSGFPRRSLWTPAPPLVLQSPRHFKPASDMTRTPAREGPGPANSRTNKRSAEVRPLGKGGVDTVNHENARAPDANLSQKKRWRVGDRVWYTLDLSRSVVQGACGRGRAAYIATCSLGLQATGAPWIENSEEGIAR